jgi:hypothetical protein
MIRSYVGMLFASLAPALALGAAGCSGDAPESGAASSNVTAAAEPVAYSLPGFDETLLAAADGGEMVIFRAGETSSRTAVDRPLDGFPVAGRSFGGSFYVLGGGGELAVIDPARASVVRSVATGVTGGADVEVESDAVAYVTSRDDGVLRKIDPSTGEVLAALDLSGGGTAALGTVLRVRDRLFVQVQRFDQDDAPVAGAVAVVDAARMAPVAVVALEAPDPSAPGETAVGINPGGPMVYDEANDRVFVAATGERPANTGMLFRLDPSAPALEPWVLPANSGFQGPVALGTPGRDMFVSYHTSTPVASTHLFRYELDADGRPAESQAGSLLDAFEEVTAFPANAARTLFALGVSCPAGFCIGGAGVSFVSARDGAVLPRLPAADLGLKPAFLLFKLPTHGGRCARRFCRSVRRRASLRTRRPRRRGRSGGRRRVRGGAR